MKGTMDQAHRRLIKQNIPALVRDLDFPALMQYIISGDIYPEHKLQSFEAIADKQKQNTDFLLDIQRRGPKAFGVLVNSLYSAKQEYLAVYLDPDGQYKPRSVPYIRQPSKSDGIEDKDPPWIKKKEDCYPVGANPRGILLLINNETFVDSRTLPAREGTDKDVERVVRLFSEKLGFLVVKKQNLKLAEMKQLYEEFQKKDHTAYDCFVSVILSHGLHDGVCAVDYDKDKHEVLSIEGVVAGMDSCKTLQGKPKVFLTQACRGEKVHKPHKITTDARRPPEDIERERLENLSLQDKTSSTPSDAAERMHVGSDVLITYPCIKGYAAAREPDQGTWYIKSLCEVLEKHHQEDHFVDILTKVNNEVGNNRGLVQDGSIVTQTSEYTTTLRKKLYFPPRPLKQSQQATN